jgi:hypothetical protein
MMSTDPFAMVAGASADEPGKELTQILANITPLREATYDDMTDDGMVKSMKTVADSLSLLLNNLIDKDERASKEAEKVAACESLIGDMLNNNVKMNILEC